MPQSQALMESLENRLMLSVDNNFYISDSDGILYTLNLSNGVATRIGNMGVVMGDIALSPGGKLVGSGNYSSLYEINPITAETTYIGYMGDSINAMVFSKEGILYGADDYQDKLFTIDPNTGSDTLVGHMSGFVSAGDLVFDEKGFLYMSSSGDDFVWVSTYDSSGYKFGKMGFSKVFGLGTSPDGTIYGVTSGGQLFSINDQYLGVGTFIAQISGVTGYILGAASKPYTKSIILPPPPPPPPPPPVQVAPTLANLNIDGFVTSFKKNFTGKYEKLTAKSEAGLRQLLSFFKTDTDSVLQNDLRYAAYMLATAKCETGNSWSASTVEQVHDPKVQKKIDKIKKPDDKQKEIEGYFNELYSYKKRVGKWLGNIKPTDGYTFRGRGYVQLTGRDHYVKLGKLLNPAQKLKDHPDLTLKPWNAYKLLTRGMMNPWLTRYKLGDFFVGQSSSFEQYKTARYVVNGTDANEVIAGWAVTFEGMLRDSQIP